MEFGPFVDLLKNLIRQPSVVGAEKAFFRVLQRELEERGARVTWYQGLLVAQGEHPASVYFSAHADRHGLICTGPKEFQYAAFVAGERSDLLGNSVSEHMMEKVAGRFESTPVLAYEPWSGAYLGSGTITSAFVGQRRRNLIFEVDGLDHLHAGVPIAFRDSLQLEDGLLSAQLDNVFSVAALVQLFDHGFQGTAFFSAQEESGKSWRYLLEWFRRFGGLTNRVLVLDTSPFADRDLADRQQVVLRHRDANGEFDPEFTAEVEERCRALGVTHVFKDELIEAQNREAEARGEKLASFGSTELGRIVAASEGLVSGTTLQLPTSGYHTMLESASLHAAQGFLDVLADIARITRR